MKDRFIQLSVVGLFVMGLSACSTIRNYFPDKAKEYQLTSEIPDLVIPPDLSESAIFSPSKDEINKAVVSDRNAIAITDDIDDKEVIYVDLVEYAGGATRIRIEDSIERSWRTVGKALSRHSIEITDRNELDRIYFVQYDADFNKVEDGSLWDEAMFLFGADPAAEKEFRIKLGENGSLTEIIVLDTQDRPLSKGAGLKLLNLLYKTIKEDLS